MEVGRETGFFEYHQYTEYMLDKYGLLHLINDPERTVPVKVTVTFDGDSVSRFLGHVTSGYKLEKVAQITCNLMFTVSNKNCTCKRYKGTLQGGVSGICSIFVCIQARKGVKDHISFPAGYVFHLEKTGRGGTAKVKTFPCYFCAVTSATLVAAQPVNSLDP